MKTKKPNNRKLFIIAVIAAVLTAGSITAGVIKTAETQRSVANQDETIWGDKSLGIDPVVDEELSNYRTIILYGLDNKKRSDIMMFFCIDKRTNKAKVFSVYRDTYMQISNETVYSYAGTKREFFKCNHAYNRGGKYESMKELNRHLDMNAKECFGMDWEAVGDLIDWLGGIELNVTEGMIPWMNSQLPDDNYKIKKPGKQHLSGWQAVQYLRCRKDPGSDATTRAARNLNVFLQIFHKSQLMSTSDKMQIFESVVDECETNMSNKRLTELLDLLSEVELESEGGWPYDYELKWQDDRSFYYYVPQTLQTNVQQLHKKMFGQENYEPTETVKALSKKIQKKENEELISQ